MVEQFNPGKVDRHEISEAYEAVEDHKEGVRLRQEGNEYELYWSNKPKEDIINEYRKQVSFMDNKFNEWRAACQGENSNPYPGDRVIEAMYNGTFCDIKDLERIMKIRNIEPAETAEQG